MSDDIETNFDKYVMGQTIGKMHVISVHLWIEHLLIECLKTVVPNPSPLFRDRGMGFAQLVSLCEAHQVVSNSLAEVLRKANGLRNKCAHQLTFNPDDTDWLALDKAIESVVPSRGGDNGVDSLRRLADFLEEKAIAIGALAPSVAQQTASLVRGP
jgi:hypothetical protein